MSKKDLRIVSEDRLGDTHAFRLIVEGFYRLSESGYGATRGGFPAQWSDRVIYVEDDATGEAVGVLTFSHQQERNTFYVTLGYVEPASRGQGIYRMMWNELVEIARHEGITRIEGETHKDNNEMHAVMKALGRRPVSVSYVYDIED